MLHRLVAKSYIVGVLGSRNADLNSVGGDERAMAELRNLRRELDQAKEQLGRRNKEAARVRASMHPRP